MFKPILLLIAGMGITIFVGLAMLGQPRAKAKSRDSNPDKTLAAASSGINNAIHDLALAVIQTPGWVYVTPQNPSVTESVLVGIQNRGDHDERIDENIHLGNGVTTGLIRLTVTVIDDDDEGCVAAEVVPRPRPLLAGGPKLLIRPKSGYSVNFDVTFRCTAPKPRDRKDRTPWDYSFSATVHHEVLDGNPDSDPSDDVCPRQPIPPKRGIEDKGCGWRLRGQPFGPYVTDVILKSPEKR